MMLRFSDFRNIKKNLFNRRFKKLEHWKVEILFTLPQNKIFEQWVIVNHTLALDLIISKHFDIRDNLKANLFSYKVHLKFNEHQKIQNKTYKFMLIVLHNNQIAILVFTLIRHVEFRFLTELWNSFSWNTQYERKRLFKYTNLS